jgi:hypothetical protein
MTLLDISLPLCRIIRQPLFSPFFSIFWDISQASFILFLSSLTRYNGAITIGVITGENLRE